MKKTLIALAAIAATSAFAQSTVTIYGNVDVGYGSHTTESRDGSVFTKTAGVMDGSWAGSRIGFKGTEDLGGGLKANFLLEQGISPTSADGYDLRTATGGHQINGSATQSTGNNRQSYLGVSGNFGEVRVGYQYTNSYDLVAFSGYSISEFQGGNYQNLTNANGTRSDAITYISPIMSGVTVKAQLGSGTGRATTEGTADLNNGYRTNNNTYTSLMAIYAKGPVSVGYAYSKAALQAVANAAATTNIFGGAVAVTAVANTAERSQVSHVVGGSYDFGVVKLSATFGQLNDGGSVTTTAESTTKAKQYSLAVPFGATTLFVSTGSAKKTTEGVAADVTDSSGSTLGASYAFSKRTMVYGYWGSEKNEAVATAATAGYKDSKTMVGLRHTF